MQNSNTRRGYTQQLADINNKSHSRVFLSGIFNACRNKTRQNTLLNRYVEDPRLRSSGMTSYVTPPHPAFGRPLPQGARGTTCGFTLIELLVVVLIIGVLAAVALPQYQKAVEKSKTVEVISLLKSLGEAQLTYQLENGVPATSFDKLDIKIPASYSGSERCNLSSNDARSNGEWAIEIINSGAQIEACRIKGKYAGGSFWFDVGMGVVRCIERGSGTGNFTLAEPGAFCEGIMNSPFTTTNPSGKLRYYSNL